MLQFLLNAGKSDPEGGATEDEHGVRHRCREKDISPKPPSGIR